VTQNTLSREESGGRHLIFRRRWLNYVRRFLIVIWLLANTSFLRDISGHINNTCHLVHQSHIILTSFYIFVRRESNNSQAFSFLTISLRSSNDNLRAFSQAKLSWLDLQNIQTAFLVPFETKRSLALAVSFSVLLFDLFFSCCVNNPNPISAMSMRSIPRFPLSTVEILAILLVDP